MSEESVYETLKIVYENEEHSTKGFPKGCLYSEDLKDIILSSSKIARWFTRNGITHRIGEDLSPETISFTFKNIHIY